MENHPDNLSNIGATCLRKMGASSSRQDAAADPVPSSSAANLAELREARAERDRHRSIASLALQEAALLREEHEQLALYVPVGAACVAAASAAVTFLAVRRRQANVLAEAKQMIVDLKSRNASELSKAQRFAAEPLAKSLVPSLDNLDAMCDADASEGALLTRTALHAALREHGIEPVAPEVGGTFDPMRHEAMYTQPTEPGGPKAGEVASVFRPGYVLHGERVLRAAQVGVAAEAEAQPGEEK